MPEAKLRAAPAACRSSTCKTIMVAAPSPADTPSRRQAFLVVFDCDDAEALAQLRAIAPCAIALDGEQRLADRRMDRASLHTPSAPEDELTARQKDILGGVLRGLSNKEIGRELGISHFTVRNHVSRLLQHLAMPSRRQLRRVLADQEAEFASLMVAPAPRVHTGSLTPFRPHPAELALRA